MQTEENNMALNSMFFERALMEAGKVITRLSEEDVLNENELSYQEGRVSMCYQIYRQNVRNPKLLEISEKRLADIKELRALKLEGNTNTAPTEEETVETPEDDVKTADTHVVDNPDVGSVDASKDPLAPLTEEQIDNMKFQDMKKYVVENKIEVANFKTATMKKALKGMIS